MVDEPIVYAYVVTVRPGQMKGWARHEFKDDRYSLIAGEDLLLLLRRPPRLAHARRHPAGRAVRARGPPDPHPARRLAPALQPGPARAHFVNFPTEPYHHEAPDRLMLPWDTDELPVDVSKHLPGPPASGRNPVAPGAASRCHAPRVPTQLTTAQHLAGLSEAMRAFVRYADRAGLEARVPTCPDWTVLDLVAHQGMVHRWAAALLRGERPTDDEVAAYEPRAAIPSTRWAGWPTVRRRWPRTVRRRPDDVEALVFLNDAPPARDFWARRQCHETTMHAVDALAASLGRPPRPERGLDRPRAGRRRDRRAARRLPDPTAVPAPLRRGRAPRRRPDDLADWWEVDMGPRPAVTTRRTTGDESPDDADWELTGGAVELYLRLWNRTDPPEEWRRLTAVTWS